MGAVKVLSKIKKLPDTPGVYEFLDSKRRIIYVGKARRLRKRVSSYFQPGRVMGNRLELLVREVSDIKIIKTSSEAEALIYEAGLIKDHVPKFNVELKDDKSYPFLKLTMGEKYPRLFLTRTKRTGDGAVYYGPYVNVKLLKEALSFMKKVFPLRSCRHMPKSICLEYHIGQCVAPCEKRISVKEYKDVVGQLKKFLEGNKDDLIHVLRETMRRASHKREYEKALFAKKRIETLTAVRQFHDSMRRPIYGELDELQNVLGISSLPVVIECFDVSNIIGQQAVGSMVRFVAGKPRKGQYRKFRIKAVGGIDDYSMIREVIKRRYSRLLREKKTLPNVVLIDGGKGHLSVARKELDQLGLKNLPAASIAKEYNHLYTAARVGPIRLSPGSRLLLLIQRIRDEAHRFAINYHRKLRRQEKFDTELIKIKGIGPNRQRILLEKFGSVMNVRGASQKEIQKCGIDKKTASVIVGYFQKRCKI